VPDRVEALFKAASGKREGMAAWLLLFYALWHRAHIEHLPVDGSLMDVLAAA
jgi:asparagine synthase (glutamine-hydrolysing)